MSTPPKDHNGMTFSPGSSPNSMGSNWLYNKSARGNSPRLVQRRLTDADHAKPRAFVPQRFDKNEGYNSPRRVSQSFPIHDTPDFTTGPRLIGKPSQPSLDPRQWLNQVTSLVKTRNGSVLGRNAILKMDHFSSGTNTKLDFHLQGAPNFRVAELSVYGVAQPTVIGLSSILALLHCHPKSHTPQSCTWFLTREEPLVYLNGYPYVLRDYASPMQNMSTFLGINAARLEKVEERLKDDVLKESKKMGGLLLVHQELADGSVVPCFIAADKVQTPREVFEAFQAQGYRIKYFRIPISPVQAPEDNYFDEYVRVIKTLEPTDPLIFNCGMGAVRTTVGIIVAQIIRRTQLIERGDPDPFPIPGYTYSAQGNGQATEQSSAFSSDIVKGLEEADTVSTQNHALLRVIYVLEKDSKMSPRSAIEWTMERGSLIENLKEAILGNYQSVLSLASVLDSGVFSKRMLDKIIDRSDAVINIREDILTNRIRQTTQTFSSKEDPRNSYLAKAMAGLQRYSFLLCFTAYINESPDTRFETRFSDWVRARSEIWTMIQHLRRKGPQFYLFRPVDDLRNLTSNKNPGVMAGRHGEFGYGQGMFEMMGAGAQSGTVASEMEDFILKARTGVVLTSQTILKVDFWRHCYMDETENNEMLSRAHTPSFTPVDPLADAQSLEMSDSKKHHIFFIDGVSNFRRVRHTHVYGVAQPTVDGLRKVIRRLLTDKPRNEKILWVNLREEPIIYINGIPYVLRDRYFTLRNIRAYKGITGARLEQLEERLKEDVQREVVNYDGRILLHGEDKEGDVQPAWEEVQVDDVMTVREVMESVAYEISQELNDEVGDDVHQESSVLDYHRVPITAEKSPDINDFDELRNLVASVELSKTALIMNCQIGLGRSTIGTVIATLLTRWMSQNTQQEVATKTAPPKYLNYQIINSLLRVIKNGLEIKSIVDDAIDKCGAYLNLRDVIESTHIQAESEPDLKKRKRIVKRGILALERYFLLICFQAYLSSTSPDIIGETESFEQWIKRHGELRTIQHELRRQDLSLLVPVEKSMGDGVALSSEVMKVVSARHGQVLAQQTILKHDAFPGCQKMSLKEKIDGAYNFRRVEVKKVKSAVKYGGLAANKSGLAADMERQEDDIPSSPFICGCAMPSKDAIKAVLKSMNAGPGGKRKVLWTCLREEPVLYVNKQPYVLRLFQDPLKNLETTGIAKERVESMENRMRLDVLEELKEYDSRLLLHDEEQTEKGGFTLIPIWETVPVECVETPAQAFQSIVDEGYQVDYLRIPITDEQAPIPDVFDQLVQRMLSANAGVDALFNCQMGRGRTTTGMVTACLMSMILKNDSLADMTSSYIVDPSSEPSTPVSSSALGLYNKVVDESFEERERYLNGEYKIILQLVSVLTYGKLAKRLTDQAINMCDHMQNLRKAMYDYKLRLDATEDRNGKKWKATREVAINYLVRYFYLIVFANYLLEETDNSLGELESGDECEEDTICDKEARKMSTFKSWLNGRREITNIIKLQAVDLS
ncbi:inositol hexakisphosphate-domain-containing protein [Phycomyces blakesleeanus]|uniref:Inositol hexakisphosphate-domain-containing protein n=1 Tax=Phycomyces blakesleeanus TaxID=4837 RepID=A0ABR3AZ16_PHYBL